MLHVFYFYTYNIHIYPPRLGIHTFTTSALRTVQVLELDRVSVFCLCKSCSNKVIHQQMHYLLILETLKFTLKLKLKLLLYVSVHDLHQGAYT
jgi:hypothetical protein